MRQIKGLQRWGTRAGQVLALSVTVGALGACDSLLEVELPHLLTDAAIDGAGTAQTQVYSAIALFECGYSAFGLMVLGHEDVSESVAGVYGGGHVYQTASDTGTCDTSETNDSWFDQIMGARAMLTTAPAGLAATSTGVGLGVYDRIQNEWDLGADEARLSAIAAIYVAASLTHLGEFVCEVALDGSDMLSPSQTLDLAESWVNAALGHIGSDFAMPNGIAASAEDMATAMLARIRWANGDLTGANSAATTVLNSDPEFEAWITRESGETRRNKIFVNEISVSYSGMLGVNDWWNINNNRRPNPATGQSWPAVIPFTGYLFLSITPDGRTLEAGNTPVVWAEEFRAMGADPTSLGNGTTPDTRTLHHKKNIQGPQPREVPSRYESQDDDIPYMT